MAENVTARKEANWRVISTLPDVCKTPMGSSTPPVPYPVLAEIAASQQPAGTVRTNGNPLVLFDASYLPTTVGDQAGVAKGIKSGTVGAKCWPKQRSSTVRVEGKRIIRVNDQFWMNGNYSAPPSKAERWKGRQEQIAQARERAGKMPPGEERNQLTNAANRFEKNNIAIERARLSQNVYDPSQPPPEGWRNASNDPKTLAAMGLKPSDLQIPGSDFRAQVYSPDPAVFGNQISPEVAFKGTVSGEDWSNNLSQGLDNNSTYYERAVKIGDKLGKSGASAHLAGHSLGGGLASAAARASGLPATTFNAAGLHPNTVARYGGTVTDSAIEAYRVDGEVLTHVQEGGFWDGGPLQSLLGRSMPDAVGTPHEIPGHGVDRIRRHFMSQVVDGIESQKKEDQAIIEKSLAKPAPVRSSGASGSW
ncbi:DUF4150 domain-containing protein [Xanthomonas cerealis pv. cerealis]|uniref:DUF4150 domain-containing protein n=1 Tax=Xanthomonas cerealis pv. cerealis TaxID=152263 RepID=A0A514EFM0_9XANT|nr:PAAR-like domain-containing protein [Xanthomonas translucens]QDI04828.1 DUF4150 domain-containing protein [Xanthomonas translucens pv. cerealis]